MSIDFFTQLSLKGIEVHPHSSDPDEFKICCIFCSERNQGQDFRFRLGFNIKSGLGHCYNCGWSSRKALLEILRAIGSEHWGEIRAENFTGETRKRPEPVSFPQGFEKLKDVDENDPVFGYARRYVRKRGITPRQLRVHEIGATVLDPKLHHRVIFPVRYGDMLAGMVGRDWTNTSSMRYINTVGNKSAYNVHPDKYPMGKKIIIISEGVTKALAIERATGYQMVCSATLGNSITAILANQFKEFDEVVLFPDPDMAGMVGYLGVADNLQPHVKKVSMVWPWPEMQADEMAASEIMEFIEARRDVTPLLRMRIKSLMRER
jgi:hypothetical protein